MRSRYSSLQGRVFQTPRGVPVPDPETSILFADILDPELRAFNRVMVGSNNRLRRLLFLEYLPWYELDRFLKIEKEIARRGDTIVRLRIAARIRQERRIYSKEIYQFWAAQRRALDELVRQGF